MPEQAYTQTVATIPRDDVHPKPVRWVGSSREDLRSFPEEVQRKVGGALWDAQIGEKSAFAKPIFGVIYVLHAFQKKSKRGIATPKAEKQAIEQRLKRAEEDYEQWTRNVRPISG